MIALACVHVVLILPPWRFATPGVGLESSWQQVVTHAAASGWLWGRDIAFTYGPLGYAWYAIYFEPLLASTVILNSMFVAALAIGIAGLLQGLAPARVLLLYAPIIFAGSLLGPGFYAFIPFLAAMNYFRDGERERLAWVVPLIVVSGVLGLTYVPSGILAFALAVIMDVRRLFLRRVPLFSPMLFAAAVAALVAAGQPIGAMPDFLRSSLEFVTGYGEAMSSEGRAREIPFFLVLSTVAAALVLWWELPALKDARSRRSTLLLLACMGLFWLVMFKTGFVRHDLHSVWSWAALAIALAAFLAMRASSWSTRAGMVGGLLAIALAACCAEVFLVYAIHGSPRGSFIATQARRIFVDVPLQSLGEARQLFWNTAQWQATMRERRATARAEAHRLYAGLRVPGTVDMIGTAQGALLLQDVDFRPRPVFQDYAAFTPWLVNRNRAHLRGAGAAATLFLSLETIDERYPMQDRGRSVLEILAHYQPEQITDGFLRLRRRSTPLDLHVKDLPPREAPLGQWVDVTAESDALLLSADVRPNVLGRLLQIAFRLPRVELTVRLADGKEHSHRVVPAIARDGILLSPYLGGLVDFAALASGVPASVGNARVVAFRLDIAGESGGRWFDARIPFQLAAVHTVAREGEALGDDLRRVLERRANVNRMADALVPRTPMVDARDTLLFAHAPVTARLAVTSARRLDFGYGITDGAWTSGAATDGACFRVYAEAAGRRTRLLERCLKPTERPDDRGETRTSVPVDLAGPGVLVFETDCAGTCSWDWTYWKDIDVTPATPAVVRAER